MFDDFDSQLQSDEFIPAEYQDDCDDQDERDDCYEQDKLDFYANEFEHDDAHDIYFEL